MSQSPAPRRNPRIEALRLVAIAGIAVFHTLLPWFDMAQLGWWVPSAPVALILGVVSLLGAFGNHVFFLVSGLFLLPRAADASEQPGYWHAQARSTARRALVIVLSVALYAAAALAVSAWVTPVPGVSLAETGWLVGGLEFIWVYLAVVALCPVIGWVWRRTPRAGALVLALVACVFAVNAYIAFVSPGEEVRDLLEWRKLMSAVTYLASFLTGGLLARARLERAPLALACGVAATLVAEGLAALAGDLAVMDALSFKSTSLLSFVLAVCAVALAARPRQAESESAATRMVCAASPSVLGFYITQSIFSPLWQPVATQVCQWSLDRSEWLLLAVGTVFSLALLALALLIDRIMRIPLLKAARLA